VVQSNGGLVTRLVSAKSLSCILPTGSPARRRLPSRGSLGPRFPTFRGTMRRYDCHLPLSGSFACRSCPDTLRAPCVRGVRNRLVTWWKQPRHARAFGHPVPHSGYETRRQMALPSSRVPSVETCPALRPRWCPAHLPSRAQDCCLPAHANRRLTTTIPISGLNDAASPLATPGFVRPLAGRHAGSLLTCWLDLSQVGLEPSVLTHWETTTNFVGFHPLPRFRAYLGASMPWFGREALDRGQGSAVIVTIPPLRTSIRNA
jgi:hypothetical protein